MVRAQVRARTVTNTNAQHFDSPLKSNQFNYSVCLKRKLFYLRTNLIYVHNVKKNEVFFFLLVVQGPATPEKFEHMLRARSMKHGENLMFRV